MKQPQQDPRATCLTVIVWTVALTLLLANDHILKGSGLLPGWLTGKLSDVAGLIVAPLLLVTALRIRSVRGRRAAFILVGAIFSLLQVSPQFALLWDSTWTAAGIPWQTWSDPTDLLALFAFLPAWALSRHVLVLGHSARIRTGGLIAVSALACMATSAPQPRSPATVMPERAFEADAYLHALNQEVAGFEVLYLADDAQLDCDAAELDLDGSLSIEHFVPGYQMSVTTHANVPLWPMAERSANAQNRGCYAVRVELGADKVPWYVFWKDDSPAVEQIQASSPNATLAAVLLDVSADGTHSLRSAGTPHVVRASD